MEQDDVIGVVSENPPIFFNPQPKPERSTEPKARKAIPRKRLTPRAYKTPRCIWTSPAGRVTCKKPQEEIDRCLSHAKEYLDALRSRIIRQPGVCLVNHRDERWVSTPFPCAGGLQDNHGIERGAMRTRWYLENGLPGCAAVNGFAHQHKRLWTLYLIRTWGEAKHARIVEKSVSGPLPVYADVLAEYKAILGMP